MVRHEHTGLFIAIEGLDGSGSSVQSALLASVLEKEGYRVLLTKEPTNTLVGGLIRAALTNEWKAGPEALQLLFTTDRAQHLEQEILPALEAGRIVITDRYAFSSIAYGSIAVGDTEWLKHLNDRFILPDLTLVIEVRPKICALRVKESRYEIELYDEEQKLSRVWQAYQDIMTGYPGVHFVSGEQPEAEILHELKSLTKQALEAGTAKNLVEPASSTGEVEELIET